MIRVLATGLWALIFAGCGQMAGGNARYEIVKVVDFELSPDEERIAFSAITPTGNLDIWIVDIDGKNLKKLTFQHRSATNRIAKFFKKHHWRNYFEIDMRYPKWTADGRIVFCQQLSKIDPFGCRAVSRRYWTISPNGADKRPQKDSDKIFQKEQPQAVNKFKFTDRSEKHKLSIILKNDSLWILKDGDTAPNNILRAAF